MKVCILCAPKAPTSPQIEEVAKGISQGIESKGNQTDILNIFTDTDKRLTIYDYLVVVAEPVSSFSSKVNENIGRFLENAGVVSGKRAACVLVGGVFKGKAMARLMTAVEGQGIILKTSEFLKSSGDAKAFGSTLKVERNY